MYEQFKARAEGVGAEVHRVTRGESLEFIGALLRREGVDGVQATAVWAGGSCLDEVQKTYLAGAVPGISFDVARDNAAQASVGISKLDWALADTGTLVGDQTPVEQRLVSTLPPIHVALIDSSRILPDKVALLGEIDPKTSRYLAFITGPSRTADIERVLTIGVHGPKRLIIIFIDGMEGAAQ